MTDATLSNTTPDRTAAAERCEAAVRQKWGDDAVWLEFAALPDGSADHDRLSRLWLDTPSRCRDRHVPVAVVARAAMLDDDHDEARLLLRKALLALVKDDRRWKTRIRRLLLRGPRRRVTIPVPATEGGTRSRDTATFFALYNAIASRDRAARSRLLRELSALGEGAWLKRL